MEWQRILYGVLGLIVLGILIWYAIRKKNPQDFEKKAKKYGLLGRVVGRVDSVSQETFHRYNDDDSYVYYPKVSYTVGSKAYSTSTQVIGRRDMGSLVVTGDPIIVWYDLEDPTKVLFEKSEESKKRESKLLPYILMFYLAAGAIMLLGSAILGPEVIFGGRKI